MEISPRVVLAKGEELSAGGGGGVERGEVSPDSKCLPVSLVYPLLPWMVPRY